MIKFSDIQDAHKLIAPYIHNTPVLTSESINRIAGASLYFKCENFQKIGAFKYRGASNAVWSLSDKEAPQGVATHSSGNHAQALSLAAKKRGIEATIVMPENAPQVKINAVREYGAKIIFCKPTLEARETTLQKVIDDTGAIFIHPYDNDKVIAGQGTAVIELIEETKDLDFIITPVGGGGLLSGSSLSAKNLMPKVKVIGAEPNGANDAHLSFKNKKLIPQTNPNTICDGLLTSLSNRTFEIIMTNVDDILTASDDTVKIAMQMIWERMKIVIEPSSAICLAVIMENKEKFANKRVGIVISGGNIDMKKI